jgi:phage gp16-like protein
MNISKNQISKIWVMAKSLHIDKENLYEMIYSISNKTSMTSLTNREAYRLIEKLKGMTDKNHQAELRKSKKTNITPIDFYRPTNKQHSYIDSLVRRINVNTQEIVIEGLALKTFNKPYKNLNRHELKRLIEALKSILNRKE